MRVRSMSRVGAAAAVALLLLATLCAPLSARAQMQVPKARTAAAGENQFNPRNGGAQASDEFCGSGNTALNNLAAPISTLFSGSPGNYVQLRFNNLPAESATARFNFTLLHFRQNGTKADGTTPIYYRTAAVPIGVQAPTLVTGTQIYTLMLDLPASLNCGNPAVGPDRCVLRYVYDNTQVATTQNSRVSCADVMVLPRNDVAVSVRATLAAEQTALSGATAMRRLLDSTWAKDAARKLDIFQTRAQIAAGEDDFTSQQIRMADPPVVAHGNSFTMNFVFSDTTADSAQQLANSFNSLGTSGLSDIFGETVVSIGSAGSLAPAAGLVCMLAALVSVLML